MEETNEIMRSKLKEMAKHKDKLKVAHINAQSLNNSNHFTEFWDAFSNSSVDVIGVSETFFQDGSRMDIPNYNVFNVNRSSRRGGGVALYVHNRLKAKLLAKSSGDSFRPEFIIIEVKCANETVLISCVYRPPKVGFLETYLDALSILDVIASNCNEQVVEYGQCVAPGFSAHDMIYSVYDFHVPVVKKKVITFRDFRNIDRDALICDAKSIPWTQVYDCENCDDKVQVFNDFLLQLFEKHVPIRNVCVKNDEPPWMSDDLRDMIEERDKARVKSLKTSDPEDCQIWASIRQLGIGKKKQAKVSDFPVSANELNDHYLNVSKVDHPELGTATEQLYNCDNGDSDPDNVFHFKFVPALDIYKIVSGFKSNAVGVDGVSLRFVKLFLDEIVFVLEHIINFCLQSSVFPSLWKCANVLPLPKVSNPTKCSDFRPVSILCLFAKILEKIVHDQIYDYVSDLNIMNPLQSGYRKGHSTVTALLKVADDIRQSIDHRKLTLLVLLDFSKAFDRVNHKLLLIKLRKLGFSMKLPGFLKGNLQGFKGKFLGIYRKISWDLQENLLELTGKSPGITWNFGSFPGAGITVWNPNSMTTLSSP
ncbi:uncharacterized protein LOC117644657 [Thrips palmi]|uniref:Uncharacterized protein LOC117644657 n=1 Tax=Thrips palmi TaxID=161013 RepID=A0A6P8ZM84_THRPL|nr:uncharacterized protein LOC117644657 [Thrips palmi]